MWGQLSEFPLSKTQFNLNRRIRWKFDRCPLSRTVLLSQQIESRLKGPSLSSTVSGTNPLPAPVTERRTHPSYYRESHGNDLLLSCVMLTSRSRRFRGKIQMVLA